MKGGARLLWLSLFGLLAAASCNVDGSCCSNQDCTGSNICSAVCRNPGDARGVCEYRCAVDLDCPSPQVCNQTILACGCGLPVDGGTVGTCAPGGI